MSDESKELGDESGGPTSPRVRAEDNAWYLLATLYCVPEKKRYPLKRDRDDVLRENRKAWNRWFAQYLDEETRVRLIEENRHPADELEPDSSEEWQKVFAERCKASAKDPVLADLEDNITIDLSDVEFEQNASFKQFLFSRHTSFRGADFRGSADLAGATFLNGANFGGATFSGDANLGGTKFERGVLFNGGKFYHSANFSHSDLDLASFNNAKFFGAAYFVNTTFAQWGHFQRAAFSKSVTLSGATFSGEARFDEAIFCGRADFGAWNVNEKSKSAYFGGATTFVNAKMKGETSFEGAIFDTEPPRFFGAKLHQGTVWRGVTWPPSPKDKKQAGYFMDAYACLKLEMDRLKKHEDELDFFGLELQSRRVWLGSGSLQSWAIALYGHLSDYGRSYLWPLAWLAVVVVIGAWPIWYFDADRTCWDALGLSAANTLSVFGFRKDFDLAIVTPLTGLIVLAVVQTILGTVLLFLIGLGIRNKFRMK